MRRKAKLISVLLAAVFFLPACITGTNQPDWDKIIKTNQQTVAISEQVLTVTLAAQGPITERIGEKKYYLLLSGCYWGWLTARESLFIVLTGHGRADEMPPKNEVLAERVQVVLNMHPLVVPEADKPGDP